MSHFEYPKQIIRPSMCHGHNDYGGLCGEIAQYRVGGTKHNLLCHAHYDKLILACASSKFKNAHPERDLLKDLQKNTIDLTKTYYVNEANKS